MINFFDRSLGFAVNRTAHVMRGHFRAMLDSAGLNLTPEEAVLIGRLTISDGLSQSELAENTIREKSTVTRLLDSLVRKGYVRREHDEQDRRVVRAWLTDAGRKEFVPTMEVAQGVLRDATNGVTEEELEITIRSLRRVCENLDALDATRKSPGKNATSTNLPR